MKKLTREDRRRRSQRRQLITYLLFLLLLLAWLLSYTVMTVEAEPGAAEAQETAVPAVYLGEPQDGRLPGDDTPATERCYLTEDEIEAAENEMIEATEDDAPIYITIPTHLQVKCFGQPDPELRNQRKLYYYAVATDVPGWESGQMLGFEEMQIALRTRFQETDDTVYALKLLSDITTGGKITYNDNGVATSVVTQKGIALHQNESIRPVVTLKPYRTFQEVDQPASPFLIRVSERGISFVEADGSMWKLAARKTIKAFLEEQLQQEVGEGSVIVAL